MQEQPWPELPLQRWQDTYATLHMWTQIVGKIRLALTPRVNHWWEVPFYVTATGLTTSPIAYRGMLFEIQFNFLKHELAISTCSGQQKTLPLRPQSVAAFYAEFMAALRSLDIPVSIWPMPAEIPNPISFDQDEEHKSYEAEYAHRFWRILTLLYPVFQQFRAGFIGKHSPIHFFWGSFDFASTRFSGRRAPERQGADLITREAYSHEVISTGFWPGGGDVKGAAFYAYAAPEPSGFKSASVLPEKAFYSPLGEFLLMYDDVRQSATPARALLDFLQSTYEAGASLGNGPRAELERPSSDAT